MRPGLSIVIVSYNVKDLLQQCLEALPRSSFRGGLEVIVVDNASTDTSMDMIPAEFPQVKFIRNQENLGFARACNQGWRSSQGQHVLFLNPDTKVNKEVLEYCGRFLDSHSLAGAVGVRMVNEKGRFLRESKRGYPAVWASIYKFTGLAALFPRSARFAAYYRGEIDQREDAPVEVLSGAFMYCLREALEKTGGFDERYFMYGEDIDLSRRIKESGYGIFYLGSQTILHYKGKSTPSSDSRYVHHFYEAMNIYVNTYYYSPQRNWIKAGIWMVKQLAYLKHFILNFFNPS